MDILDKAKEFAKRDNIPIIKDNTADFLAKLIQKTKPQRILEIGTAIGYSGSLMLLNSPKARLTTIDINSERLEYAKQLFNDLRLIDRVEVIEMDAMQALLTLDKRFDFVFLDGPKAQYYKYLPLIKGLLVKNGTLFVDNIYCRHLENSPRHTHLLKKLAIFRDMLFADKDLRVEFSEQ